MASTAAPYVGMIFKCALMPRELYTRLVRTQTSPAIMEIRVEICKQEGDRSATGSSCPTVTYLPKSTYHKDT